MGTNTMTDPHRVDEFELLEDILDWVLPDLQPTVKAHLIERILTHFQVRP